MVSVVIEPYEPLIYKAIQAIEQKAPNYFGGIQKIVLEHGDPGHFGKVHDNDDKTIYVSLQKIRSSLSGKNEEDIIQQVAEVLAHEMGHIKSQFQGGEAPAEKEELDMRNQLQARLKRQMRSAQYKRSLVKVAAIKPSSQPSELADSILRIVYHFAQKVGADNHRRYLEQVAERLRGIAAGEISSNQRNPGGGIGASVSLTKNILAGLPPDVVNSTLAIIQDRVTKL